ncbi:MAG: IS66 family transposase [Burkholderiales bacterium]|nr:MAG: IS66 family transposase [Burkholderiales bacterium]
MSLLDQTDKKRALPSDIPTLEAMLVERDLLIEKLKLQIARMKRVQFGQSSERLDAQILQLELIVEDLESKYREVAGDASSSTDQLFAIAETPPVVTDDSTAAARARALPEHLPRERVRYEPQGAGSVSLGCKHCGAQRSRLTRLGEDESEMPEYVPGRFKVIVQVRPKYLCNDRSAISQASAPSRPLARSYPGPALLAHVLTAKYCDHLRLYRQSEINAREDVELSRSRLADWVGGCSQLLSPLVFALLRYVLDGEKLQPDDTPVPVLQPGRGATKNGRLWVYNRDDRSAPINSGDPQPAAVWFAHPPDRKGEHPQRHLRDFKGILQADGYAGY